MVNLKRSPTDDQTVASETDASQSVTVNEENEQLQEVMSDNLELMLEIIMKVREDEDFAKSVYADCPRLQHLLDQHPDLRPIFEDPKIVRINFETVYRKAGGRLPEDKVSVFAAASEKFKKTASYVVDHPAFKVFQFLVFLKKCYTFVVGFGANAVRAMLSGMFGSGEYNSGSSTENNINSNVEDQFQDAGLGSADDLHKEGLYKAAEHMEDPDVREKMNSLVDGDPDKLSDAIENDVELRSLRESNALCAELMSDPSTMRILVDPENLRALGDCPDLIEMDFADPGWKPDPFDAVPFDDTVTPGIAPDITPELDPGVGSQVLEEMELDDETNAANKKHENDQGDEETEQQEGTMASRGGYMAGIAGLGAGVYSLATGNFALPGVDTFLSGDVVTDAVNESVDAVAEKSSHDAEEEEDEEIKETPKTEVAAS
jgi:hypothetical protein